jgi:hypothetical protein
MLSVIHRHDCHSLPKRSLVVTNTCLWQRVTSTGHKTSEREENCLDSRLIG